MSAPTNGTTPRPASAPAVGGIRGAILAAIIALIAKVGLPQEFSDPVVAAVSAIVGFGLAWIGKVIRDKYPWVPSFLIPI